MKRLLRGAMGGIALAMLGGCSDEGSGCPAIGCGPPLRVYFVPPLAGGTFDVTLSAPGYDTYRCAFSTTTATKSPETCPAPLSIERRDGQVVSTLVSWQPIFSPTVRLEHDGEVVAEETLTTEYQETGNGCGTCRHAEVTLRH